MEMFDITPLGRIVNRFSKDVDTIDNTLPLNLRVVILQLFAVIIPKKKSICPIQIAIAHTQMHLSSEYSSSL